MIRYIIFQDESCYGGSWPAEADGGSSDPIPSYSSYEEATGRAVELKLVSPKGRRNDSQILAVKVTDV